MEDGAFKHWTSYVLICNSDDEKCGTLKTTLRSRCGGNLDECPRTLEEAHGRLSSHKLDNYKPRDNERKGKDEDAEEQDPKNIGELNFNQKGGATVCFICGSKDHTKWKCPVFEDNPKMPQE